MPAKIMFLTGAPRPSALDWSKVAPSNDDLLPAFSSPVKESLPKPTPQTVSPQWRLLPLEAAHPPTVLTQRSPVNLTPVGREDAEEASFITAWDISPHALNDSKSDDQPSPSLRDNDELSQYYEHSFAIHDGTDMQGEGESFNTELDEDSIVSSDPKSDYGAQQEAAQVRLSKSDLSSLKDIPSAGLLRSLLPQTVTVDLVVGIISISKPRAVITRKGGCLVELVELLVGEETRAGFAINIWLRTEAGERGRVESNHSVDDLRAQTLCLRPRDVILARHVALGSFKGKVHGQSLRKGVTTLDLLYRDPIDSKDRRGALKARDLDDDARKDSSISRVRQTRSWVAHFVGAGRRCPANPSISTSLPADTQ